MSKSKDRADRESRGCRRPTLICRSELCQREPQKRSQPRAWSVSRLDFLKAHSGAIAATDFFSVDVLTAVGLVRYVVLFVGSARRECLRKVIPLGERHLRKIVGEFVEHYHVERNHQGLGNRLIEAPNAGRAPSGAIKCRERLDGTLRYYHREAA